MSTELYYRDEHGDLHTEEQAHDMYDNMLDGVYPTVTIGSLTWDPSRVLKELDPIAYRCGFSDYTADFEEVDASELDEGEED